MRQNRRYPNRVIKSKEDPWRKRESTQPNEYHHRVGLEKPNDGRHLEGKEEEDAWPQGKHTASGIKHEPIYRVYNPGVHQAVLAV